MRWHIFAFPGEVQSWLTNFWPQVRAAAQIEGVRIHDLRHSFASRAARTSETLPTIAKLLGDATIQTTARYAHLDDQSCVSANERIGELIMAKLGHRIR
jgi:integrase